MKTLLMLALIVWLYCSTHPTVAASLVHLCPVHAAAALPSLHPLGTHWDALVL